MARKLKVSLLVLLIIMVLSVASVNANTGQKYDLGGRTIGIAFRFWGVTPLGERDSYSWLEPDPRLTAHINQVEEMFNCKIEFIRHPGESLVFQTYGPELLAGDTRVSVMEMDVIYAPGNLYPMASQGFLHAVDDILDEDYYNSLPEYFRSVEGFQVQGKTYGVEPFNYLSEPTSILWNMDLFDREGLTTPYELYDDGNWTWDTFLELATQLTKDTTGDGAIDQWGITFIWGRERHIANWVHTNNGRLTRMVDGREVIAFNEPEAVEAFEFWQKVNFEYGVARTGGYASGGKNAMIVGSPHAIHRAEFTSITDRYAVVPLPRGPRATEHAFPQANRWMMVIPATEPDPRAVIEVVNALRQLTEPYMTVSMEQFNDTFWAEHEFFANDRRSIEFFKEGVLKQVNVPNRETLLLGGLNAAINNIILRGASVATELASVTQPLQATLDELYLYE